MNRKDKFIISLAEINAETVSWKQVSEWKDSDGTRYNTYWLNGDRNLGILTVERPPKKAKKGYRMRNIFIDETLQRQGVATDIHRKINEESIANTGYPLRSSDIGYENVTTMNQEGEAFWKSLVTKGLARNIDGHYEFMSGNKTAGSNPRLPSVKQIQSLLLSIAEAAQLEYDKWNQNEDGVDEELGSGGICQNIADAISTVLNRSRIDAAAVSQQIGDQHVYVVAKFREGVYEVDIPPSVYEYGTGYTWRKKESVAFDPRDITVVKIDGDPNKFEGYIEQW